MLIAWLMYQESGRGQMGNESYNLIITETGPYTSSDPLDGDQTQNLILAQLIHRTPLEVSDNNQLTSTLLKSFSYDPNTKEIVWEASSDQLFSDGSLITPDDLVLAVLRMAAKRPNFPVLRHIEGLDEWLNLSVPLENIPSGISIEGNRITIRLKHNLSNPLFRFVLPLFGVVPSRCVDRKTNKVNCDPLVTSGYYVSVDSSENSFEYRLRSGYEKIYGKARPKRILVTYSPDYFSKMYPTKLDPYTVIATRDLLLDKASVKNKIAGLHIFEKPTARFGVFLLNPTVGPFDSVDCRRVFAGKFRKTFGELYPNLRSSYSLFTEIVPGYLSNDELQSTQIISSEAISQCLQSIQSSAIKWVSFPGAAGEVYKNTMQKTLHDLGVANPAPLQLSRQEIVPAFINGDIAVLPGGSGFWAQDPVGDLQMMMTEGLHAPLKFVSNDGSLQSLLSGLEFGNNPNEALQQVNRKIYSDALMNVYNHSKRVYLASEEADFGDIPISVTMPSPWQLFRVK